MNATEKSLARDIMVRRLQVLEPHAEVKDAVHALHRRGHSGAPVVDEEGKLLGVFGEYDCLRGLQAAAFGQGPIGTVQSYMTAEVEEIPPDLELAEVVRRFIEGGHRRLLVVEDGKLVGLICRRDLVNALEDMIKTPHRAISTYEAIQSRR